MTQTGLEKRLAAVLVADVARYTALMEADTDGTVAAWQQAYVEAIEPCVSEHAGRIVKHTGDGFLAEFPLIEQAVRCALTLQQALATSPLNFRMGVNFGDIVDDGQDIHGEGVNIAARIEAFAEDGGICLSGGVYDQIRNRLSFQAEDLGFHSLKHVSAPVRIYRIAAGSEQGPAASSLPAASAEKPSIAVLAFENRSGDPEQEYFSDGIAEDIITELGRFHSLFVISRNSSFAYKGRSTHVREIGRDLGVRYIVEGSIRTAGKRVRVTVQLTEAETGKQIWAERYDRDVEDIFDVQDDITKTVVAAIEPELGGAERERARRSPPDNLDAWGLYQRGLWHMYRFTASDMAEAQHLFEQATQADPNFSAAVAGLSFVHFTNAYLGYKGDREKSRELALDLARRSVLLDSRDPVARCALGRAFMIGKAYDEAIAELQAAVALNPNYAHAHYNLGWAFVLAGRSRDAIASLDFAEKLSPQDPMLFAFCAVRAQALLHTGQEDLAEAEARRSSRSPNAHPNSRAVLVAILGLRGKSQAAKLELATILEERPAYSLQEFVNSYPYRATGELDRLLDGLRHAGVR